MSEKEQEITVETVIHLLSNCRFDELFVGEDRDRFTTFLKENVSAGGKFAVTLTTADGLAYIVYPVEEIEFLANEINIQFDKETQAFVPTERSAETPEEILGVPVFHLSETRLW